MANQTASPAESLLTGENLTGKEGHLVKIGSAGVVLCAGATDVAVGVLAVGAEQGKAAAIHAVGRGGRTVVKSGAAITRGATLTSDGQGRAIATTTANDRIIGVATESCTGADQQISCLLGVAAKL